MSPAIRDRLLVALADPETPARWSVQSADRAEVVRFDGDLSQAVVVVSLVSSTPTAETVGCMAAREVWQLTALGANPDHAAWMAGHLEAIIARPGWLPDVIGTTWETTRAIESEADHAAAVAVEVAVSVEIS